MGLPLRKLRDREQGDFLALKGGEEAGKGRRVRETKARQELAENWPDPLRLSLRHFGVGRVFQKMPQSATSTPAITDAMGDTQTVGRRAFWVPLR